MSMAKNCFSNIVSKFVKIHCLLFLFLLFCLTTSWVGTKYDPSLALKAIQVGRSGNAQSDQSIYIEPVNPLEYAVMINKDLKTVREIFSQSQAVVNLKTKGLLPGQEFTLYSVGVDQRVAELGDLFVNEINQLVLFKDPKIVLANMAMFQQNCMKGETISYVLVSKDGKSYLGTSMQPDPIETTWNDGAHVALKMINFNPFMMLVQGENFNSLEEIKISSISCDEFKTATDKVNSDGKFNSIYMPEVVGFKGGNGKYTIKRLKSGEEKTLSFKWGDDARIKKNDDQLQNLKDVINPNHILKN